ncbi:MAG: methionine--tRNA ligase [Eubacteriaceae bacterium]|jgi:methionyl-tRNA synthetase
MSKGTFYITTPIYYPSGDLHIGHTYTTVAADTMKRFKTLTGYDAYMLTGTDEHGQKIQKVAAAAGITPQEYVDGQIAKIKDLWKLMNIDYDQFIRTTDKEHVKTIQAIFKKLYDQGDIYKGKYEGHYCTPCESFWTDSQLVDGCCPDCGRPVQTASEEAYFFKMSKYADRLIQYIEDHPDFIQPESRKNEMLNNFLKPGLQDLCVSRSSFDWGVPVTFDPKHVVYVWIDALPNYISALGYCNDKENLMDRYWPADVHLVGKDIIRFHTIYWPIILMALDLPLPKKVYGHGWILIKGGKMGKSFGNVVDPVELADKYGVDALRYHVLSDMKAGADGNYSEDLLIAKINADLANDLGNLLSRTTAMTVKYFGGTLPADREAGEFDSELIEMAEATPARVEELMNQLDFSRALETIWNLISRANKYIDETQPWVLGKDPEQQKRLAAVLYNLTETLRYVTVLISSFMPATAEEIAKELKLTEAEQTWDSLDHFGGYTDGKTIERHAPLFPRIDIEKKQEAEQAAEKPVKEAKKKADKKKKAPAHPAEITIDDFMKPEMVVGKIVSCEKHPDADRLLVSQVDIGSEVRQIVSGVAGSYTPEQMVGKSVIVCKNLKPVNLRGVESAGMLLAAENGKTVSLLTADQELAPGSEIR